MPQMPGKHLQRVGTIARRGGAPELAVGPWRPLTRVSAMTAASASTAVRRPCPCAEDEVVQICRDLIRIDTSNYGDGTGPGERKAAEYVWPAADRGRPRADAPRERARPGQRRRAGRGRRPHAGPACACTATSTSSRRTPPTGRSTRSPREVRDGCIWGRGAVDMKDMDAMMLAVLRDLARTGTTAAARPRVRVLRRRGGRRRARLPLARRPPPRAVRGRDRGGQRGRRLHHHRPTATGEPVAPTCCRPPRRASPGCGCAPTAGPGTARCSTTTTPSPARRGGRPDRRPRWPREYIATVRQLLDGLSALTGVAYADDDPDALFGHLGGARGFIVGDPAGHRQPHHARGRLQAQRHARRAPRRSSTAASCPATRTS